MERTCLKYGGMPLVLCSLLTLMAGCGMVKSLGKYPDGEALARIEALPNYRDGKFQNLDTTGNSHKVNRRNRLLAMFSKPANIKPLRTLPWVETNLKTLATPRPTIVWFGHSSLLIKTSQSNILIDPIFSGHAGPIPGVVEAFKGSNHYQVKNLPPIDVLIISHDHFDHLDYRTVRKLRNTVKMVVVPMGVGSHFIHWGFDAKKIVELNWHQFIELPGNIKITATPARHRSNRTFTENKTLWASYVININGDKLFYSGDGGYGSHFKQIGAQYGPFNLALMECGQYGADWPYSHMTPAQSAQAAADVKANIMQPVHWAKFAESDHPWNEPVNLLLPVAKQLGLQLNLPLIGEPYTLGQPPNQTTWWDVE